MIEQLPIIQMMALLIVALVSPFITSKNVMKTIMLFVLLGVFISTFYLMIQVRNQGEYLIHFGNYTRSIGIEFKIDAFNTLFTLFISGFALLVHIYSIGYLKHDFHQKQIPEYYGLLAMLYFGMFGLLYTNDLFNTYVFIEILSIATCAIISVARKKRNYMAAFRYLMLNELGSLSFLMGIALIYMLTGALNMTLIFERLQSSYQLYPVNVTLAIGLMGIGLAIKAAIFPFHEWLPDAHASAPATSSALLSGIMVKLYLLVMAKLIFNVFGLEVITFLRVPFVMAFFAGLAMIMGSVFALGQKDLKRMLAYSSVAQVGYILLALSLMSEIGLTAMLLYIFSHALLKGLLFLVSGSAIFYKSVRALKDFEGFAYLMPLSMVFFTISAFGMIGIPGTSGFIAKWQLSIAFLENGMGLYVILIIASGILNAIYYLPIIISAFLNKEKADMHIEKLPFLMLLSTSLFLVGILALGIFPGWFMPFIEAAASSLGGF